jgi:hypothetical protein
MRVPENRLHRLEMGLLPTPETAEALCAGWPAATESTCLSSLY